MKISIITVCYNSEATIESCIQSVLNQDYKEVEYIIVDGKSTDGTLVIIDKYKEGIAKIISERDEGIYFAINKGIAVATGEIVGILHSDDFLVSNEVLTQVAGVFEKFNVESMYGDLQYVSREDISKVIRNWKSKPFERDLFLDGWMPPHPTFFVKREVYKKYGVFNTAFSISADYELMLRFLYRHRITTYYLPKRLVRMRTGGVSNVTYKSRIKANLEDREAWKINNLKPGKLTLFRKPLSKLSQFFIKEIVD